MHGPDTRWFLGGVALSFAIGCSDAASPEQQEGDRAQDESADAAELDASRGLDARSAMPLDATLRADGSSRDARAAEGGVTVSACTTSASTARCTSRATVRVGVASDLRDVYWALPSEPPPAQGYPVVVLYQGSLYGPSTSWNVDIGTGTPFGGYYQVLLVSQLLAHGYAVLQPAAQGELFWSTNVSADFASSSDGVFIPLLLAAIANGTFGELDSTRMFATGISSGGYMTSRMAVSFAGRFRALAIESAAYATCGGPLCVVPSKLPADHPPTLFLHGARDTTVPIGTAESYRAALQSAGIETDFIRDAEAGHQWLANAPDAIVRWFDAH